MHNYSTDGTLNHSHIWVRRQAVKQLLTWTSVRVAPFSFVRFAKPNKQRERLGYRHALAKHLGAILPMDWLYLSASRNGEAGYERYTARIGSRIHEGWTTERSLFFKPGIHFDEIYHDKTAGVKGWQNSIKTNIHPLMIHFDRLYIVVSIRYSKAPPLRHDNSVSNISK